jgi:hypothetical protein
LKIILRKRGGRRSQKGHPLGITVTKAHGPTTPPAATIIGKGKEKKNQQYPANGLTYAEHLRTLGSKKKEKGSDNIPDFEPPKLAENLERKLQILPNEWQQETRYISDEVSALYAFYQPTQGPFIIVPSVATPDFQLDFSLTSK